MNFTYEVYEDQRDRFVSAAKRALTNLRIDSCFSKHHADDKPLVGVTVASKPLYEEFEAVGVVISRFSGVVLEAMARGIPTIYFNPFGEVIPKFNRPGAALFVATTGTSLEQQLGRALTEPLEEIRRKQDEVLRQHLSITRTPAARRAAIELESIVAANRR